MLPRDANRRQESSNGVRDPTAAAGEDGRETAAEEEAAKALHERFGFEILKGARERLGWLINYHSSVRVDKETGANIGCICCYFACQDGSMFQVSVDCPAYMYVVAEEALTVEVDGWLRRKFAADLVDVVHVEREDPNLPNHLSGLKRKLLQLAFRSQEALQRVRRELAPIVARNKQGSRATSAYEGRVGGSYSRGTAGDGGLEAPPRAQEAQRGLLDLREHDVAHHMRFAIDSDVRCGHWYEVSVQEESALLRRRADLVQRAEARVCAFDIETTKLPLQFPNAEYDQVFMISYMVDRQGYLIINREVVSEDVADFEYTPKPEFEGPFRIFNCADERACLERWFEHMREVKPAVYVTYNGDYFDWPFIETRAAQWGLDMGREIGFRCAKGGGETRSRSAVHMDCMHWVNRDSYLPQGSRGLKAVTKYKLGYDPVEVDPEDMVRFAAEKPQAMASYSVSDAVATYYLYMTYVHPFIFSLSTIIPMPPDEVLRKGSGTLCEALLMVQAAQAGVVAPNKHQAAAEKSHEGHLLDSETYIGGKVEALESGVFRSDLPCAFRLDAAAYARLARSLDADLAHALRAEGRMEPEEAENYAEVRADILARLAALEAEPVREEAPLIYHLDVAAMYPNIILTNRLQPNAIVSAQDCAACDFNRPGKTCLREMDWVWRGEAFPAGRSDYARLKAQLQSELFPAAEGGAGEKRTWFDLPFEDRQRLLRDRLKKFCHKTYKRVLNKPVTERRRAGVCQRENSFYYDTVEAFRDRRYEYKGLSKEWKGRLDAARLAGDPIEVQRAKDMCVLYDSLQLAHKCILNSFYGYVMRKGARWYSMEMAGVVTHAGASIIELANGLVSAIGRPLELDTDGIWCALPGSFPEDFVFRARGGGKDFKMSYPCAVLNALVASSCANDQFAVLEDAGGRRYRTESRMSIEFEVDGPYRAMVLPASKEEGKLIKKRYAVFNHDGSLAELKGFELKRRGELKLIKVFQAEVFDRFLLGGTLEECYAAVAAVADQWLDLLDTEGVDVTDAELVDLISETCVMSKTLEEYEGRKSCAVTCATRLSHFLGDSRIKDKGLVCHYLVARSPADAPTSERAIPVAIFSTEPAVARTFLARWCGDAPGGDWERPPDVRAIVDWAYYRERLGSAIQKIVTIPAAMQRLPNPVPRVAHPAWLLRRVREKDDRRKQTRLTGLFRAAEAKGVADLEDWGSRGAENRAPNPTGGAAARGVDEVGATGERVGEADRGIGPAPPPTPASDPPPDRREDYAGWLESRKRAWRAARAERKRKAASLPLRGPPKAPRGASLGSLLAGAAAAADAGHWQLLTVESLAAPLARRLAASSLARLPPSAPRQPTHRVWAVAGGRLRALLLRVPRRALLALPVHASHPGLARWGRPVRRTLPHGMAAATALQVELPPGAAPAAALQRDMLRLRALGVFEDRLPGSRVAALALGCVARVDAAAREGLGAAEKEVYDLDHLTMKSVAECEYFPRAPQHVLVHSWTHPSRQLGLVLVHSRGAGHVWVAVPGSRAPREVSAALLDRLWAAAQQEGEGEEGSAESGEGGPEAAPAPVTGSPPPTWTVRFAASLEAARRGADGALRALLAQQAAEPGVLLVQASSAEESSPVAALVSPAALADWPCLRLPARPAGEEPGLLGWQPAAARRAARAAAQAGRWLGARVAAAQFAHLPLSALGADWALDAADAFFARALKKEGHALWEGEGAGERGGGGEEGGLSSCEVLCRSFEAGEGGGPAPPNPQPLYARPPDVAERLLHQEAAPELTLARPSVRRTACVALQLSHLAVAALLETAALGDCEGAALGDCASGCGPALAALRALAQGWMDSAVERGNLSADALLCALRRWLADRSRPGHDPALARVVRGLMHKTLLQLAAELERLGCPAVGASGSEVLVDTQKATIPSGLGAVAYVMQALQKKEMFRWLTLAPVRAYHAVVYLDRYNYAGILADVPDRVLDVLGEDPKAIFETPILEEHRARFQADAQQARRDPRWDAVLTLKDHLPVAVQPKFFSALTEFVWLPWKAGQEAMAGDEVQGSQMVSRQAQAAFEAQRAWLRRELGGSYAERVLSHVRSTMLHVGARDGHASHAFPKLPGSCLSAAELGSPQLALVRGLCHLLGLDEQAREGVLLLRRQLLRLVRCKEFGPDAAFRDPCARVVLRDLSCAACQHCWDADLARDPLLLARAWRCPRPGCGAGLDAREAARQLAEGVRAAVDGFQLQDLPCAKCGTVAAQHLGAHCDVCSGKLRGGVRREDALGRLRAAEKVARHQGWTHVAEAAAWGVLHA